ncbi:major facilitator superfamily domain-containing protein [Zychaea mexicana]|uniref:major facilitator superfamily domain-containing protein n=1 Tax=Zychaea mexicana TaxID=64656 RepID=UPI0022FE878D|nr:major facilitator superfamily domain-containing protein [Zychaea mexicana]KAI9498350.1 major facilitator superfamily domain-containing protein [Zychaea mexicana]
MGLWDRILAKIVPPKTVEDEEQTESYFIPGALVTTLFFLWGFSYGLLDTLNKHFQNVLGITTTETTYMQVAYFGAYFVISPIAGVILKRIGYKKTIILGLLLYVLGSLCFYPAAVNESYGGFVGSLFTIASGLAMLENCANTYITIIGSRRWASLRINLSQGFNGIGTTISPIIASYAFFGGDEEATGNLDSVKWTYVGVGCGVFCIAILFCFARIPEFDEEAQMRAESEATGEVVRRASMKSPHLWLGAITQFIYTGNQVAIASMYIYYATIVGGYTDSFGSQLLALGQMCFTIGRFVGVILMRWFRADHLLAAYSVCAIIATICAVTVHTQQSTYTLMVILFFESIMFPTNFALGTRDLGRNYKYGAPILIMGVAGGALFPTLMALTKDNRNIHLAFVIPLVGFVIEFCYALFGSRWIIYVDEEDDQPSAIDKDKGSSAELEAAADKNSITYAEQAK